ncbi:MAG: transcriptional regulator [Friedmanniella sp.]|nr:transcriptional regulator [Friedmanniella sp.]
MVPNPNQERRAYHAPRRNAGAQQTRERIRTAAGELFLADGYAGTSMRSVARAAGVAEKTVYLRFPTKTDLLKEVVETAIVGDELPIPAADREWFRAVLAAPPADKMALLADASADLHERTGAFFSMARGAAAVDPEAARLWEGGKRGHLADMTIFARNLVEAGLVRPEDEDQARNTLYVLVGPESWHLVSVELGQDPAAYRAWLTAALQAAFPYRG